MEMDEDEIKAWSGNDKQHKHILGQMRKFLMPSGRTVTVLEVYRHAVDLDADHPCEVDVLGPLFGEMPIRCDVEGCNYVGRWEAHNGMLREFAVRQRNGNATYLPE